MAEDRITAADLRGVVIFAAFVYLAIRFIGAIAQILLVFGIILLITLIMNPVITWLEQRKIPRFVSVSLFAILTVVLVGLVAWLVVPRVAHEFWILASGVPSYLDRLRSWLGSQFPGAAGRVPIVSPETLIRLATERLGPLLGGITGYAISIAGVVVSALVIFISTIYALASPTPLVQGLLVLFPREQRTRVIEVVHDITLQMRAWALGTGIGMILIFLLTWVVLAALGLKSAFLIGVIAGALEIVPVLGPFIAGSLAVLAALGQDPSIAIWVFIAFVGIQQVEGHVIIPLVMSGQLQLHPISVIFAVLVMGGLFGIIGIFLASPVAAVTKVLVYKLYVEPKADVEEHELAKATEQVVTGQPPPEAEQEKKEK
jgi:predicted PurR-regulated permease PerM